MCYKLFIVKLIFTEREKHIYNVRLAVGKDDLRRRCINLIARAVIIIEDKIYAFGEEVESNAIEFIIHNIRKKVGAANIKNVRGVGWKVVKGNS